jgi:hypothetical protein
MDVHRNAAWRFSQENGRFGGDVREVSTRLCNLLFLHAVGSARISSHAAAMSWRFGFRSLLIAGTGLQSGGASNPPATLGPSIVAGAFFIGKIGSGS